MPKLSPMSIYRDQLANSNEGYALWEPDPGCSEHMQIGDLGFIHPSGCFVRIFNIFHDAKSPINTNGAPTAPEDSKLKEQRVGASLPFYMASPSVKREVIEDEDGSEIVSIKLSCSDDQGAALLIKEPTLKVDSVWEMKLADIFKNKYKSWHDFFREKYGEYPVDAMILVTGYDLTSAWATVSFAGMSGSGEATFQDNSTSQTASVSLPAWGSWIHHKSAVVRRGPSKEQAAQWYRSTEDQQLKSNQVPPMQRASQPQRKASLDPQRQRTGQIQLHRKDSQDQQRQRNSQAQEKNQCVFLRGWTIHVCADGVLLKRLAAQAGDDSLPHKDDGKSSDVENNGDPDVLE